MPVIPAMGRWRQESSWGLLASQYCSERNSVSNTRWTSINTQVWPLASILVHTNNFVQTHTERQTHRQRQRDRERVRETETERYRVIERQGKTERKQSKVHFLFFCQARDRTAVFAGAMQVFYN